ncbi:LacI family DNA-binding transcriptional regulator [Rhizobium ruizarguesonis]|uniref:LacI family DNA-binding transcriptional regulator n=1 Tax=Rhizobium ruizarguesonis TaxID=2081791 RepID=UPI000409A41C|nr:LacI family DNA-binding transcriptional regulator [Rhizobium ruizarguesonis]MBY5893277.1 substrate-binding domain-containing protein [Rhizobium leguminosarum]NKL27708.1 substrate-binding domain-containing protein [Rhizobium leguminosarum bv. viciae]NEI07639.1 substrate-binding domain-containing protein [Rhizobium ruizarguesonis]TAX64796.1 LacI family DNA-binding transcriptional regulator [Rhizobium ruizarguesonis]TAZ76978.1 LacI family DNA-binding transcriptional regulator [Rhizobium ruizar
MAKGTTPSLKDVAAAANVSVTTVSRFVNGSLDLPFQTKKRIEDAIKTLNYRPNPHARRLSRGRSDTIGLVVPDIANPFFATLVAAVEQAADEKKLAVSLHATLNRPGREIEYLQLIERNHVDGLIFVTNHPDDGALAALINGSGKVIIVDEDIPDSKAPKLFCDNEQGGYLAGQHLAEQGHRHVLFIGGDERMISARRRYDGLLKALMERHGEEARVDRYAGEYTIEYGRAAALEYLAGDREATAIFASSDEIAIGLVEVFGSRGVSIPGDISVIGFDDVGPLHLFAPPLTAIRQPVRQIGRRSLELLLETNWHEWKPSASEELVPVEIVVRNSVAPPAK